MAKPLIIFDCDGVLVDTEQIASDCMAEIFRANGASISTEECRHRFQGMFAPEICLIIEQEYGVKIDAEAMREKVRLRLELGVDAIEGVVDLVKALKKEQYEICVASSGKIKKMKTTLGQTPLLDMLGEVLFSADSVGRGKPSPDVFLYAAQQMNRDPKHAIILEDSVPGVKAGIAAGSTVLGYCTNGATTPEMLAAEGAIPFTSMHDALDLIKQHS